MSLRDEISRRGMFFKLALLFDGIVALIVALPIVGYLLSPLIRRPGYASWLSLGSLDQFPVGQTRLATYRNPGVNPWAGETADIPCWVRHVDAGSFQVFAINCAHLWCPVRWFPQSGLFMCPCHGGVYYEDGSRAAGPPPHGLFQYSYKIEGGNLLIKAGEVPIPTHAANVAMRKSRCA
jgi:quinol---cytochrome c reductase iron-sulfur subunit, bacillus type